MSYQDSCDWLVISMQILLLGETTNAPHRPVHSLRVVHAYYTSLRLSELNSRFRLSNALNRIKR